MTDHPITVSEITPGVLSIFYVHRHVGDLPTDVLPSLIRAAHEYKQRRDQPMKPRKERHAPQ